MAAGDATSADVPGKYDVVINGKGYVFADSIEPSLPFRTHRAIYDITQTFVERTNTNNVYGDQAQDFFLTASQNDWSDGEQQRFFRLSDQTSVRRYWLGTNVDIRTPGQVQLMSATSAITFGGTVTSCVGDNSRVFAADATNLYSVDNVGTESTIGAHGLGAAPSHRGMASDGAGIFMSTTAGGSVGVRRNAIGGASFTTFSATGADVLAYNNNTLYGLRFDANHDFIQYDSSGNVTSIFKWKTADGLGFNTSGFLVPYGGKMLIAIQVANAWSLWIYDGTGVTKVADFPSGFQAMDLCVSQGIAFISGLGLFSKLGNTGQIYYWDGGTVGRLWESQDIVGYGTVMTPWLNGLVFTDDSTQHFIYWDAGLGGFQSIGGYTRTGSGYQLCASEYGWLHIQYGVSGGSFFTPGTAASSGSIQTSLIDFDSSLTKVFRGVTIDFTTAAGGTVDVAYQVDSLTGAYTSLATGVTSGTEIPFSNLSGHSISIKVTLNKGASSAGPILKRISVRAAPVLRQFRSGTYIIDCTGSTDEPRELRNGQYAELAPYDQVQNLLTAAKATTPFSVTDKVNGTFTALVDLSDPDGWDVYEIHPNTNNPEKGGSYFVRVKVREV